MTATIRIFHVDDEPERVNWIPEALRNAYYLRHPGLPPSGDKWVEEDDDQGRQTFSFVLQKAGHDGGDITLSYVLVTHEALLEGEDLTGALIIMDVMRTEGTTLKAVARTHYRDLVAAGIAPERIYFLTAYGGRLPADAFPGLPPGHMMEKPIDPTCLVETLFAAMPEIAS